MKYQLDALVKLLSCYLFESVVLDFHLISILRIGNSLFEELVQSTHHRRLAFALLCVFQLSLHVLAGTLFRGTVGRYVHSEPLEFLIDKLDSLIALVYQCFFQAC